jgi:4-amino-4-deoxy-L-arabinose transferase
VIAGFIYTTSPFPVLGAYAVSTDTLLALFETGAVLCYVAARRARCGTAWVRVMWFCFGCAFLTKGPPALLPLIPISWWHLHAPCRVRLVSVGGIAIFCAAGLSWFAVVCARNEGLLAHLVGTELVGRFTTELVHNRQWYKPITKYLPMLTLGAGPWLVIAARVVARNRLWSPARVRDHLRRDDVVFFLFLWLVIPLSVFSIVPGRLSLYVLPLYAPIALAVARGVAPAGDARTIRRVAVIAVVTACVLVAVKGVCAVVPYRNDMRRLYRMVRSAREGPVAVSSLNRAKLYGLQFYLDGRLRRLSSPGKEAWADGIAADEVAALGKRGIAVPHIFIVEDSEHFAVPWLCDRLREAGFSPERIDGRYWAICVVDP